ncbi:protein phosphatase 1 regulatory subunit 36-like isoform X3 [Acipenser ruthenus]|uniref:protein phosphatase 1 regulatory subunit 36-like isoform X3 n=1 Tax=Acipenser ruthenus TaxID=7906 RepID=UPI0027404134|nr:protein phosphatase 1 regulatory subunit 36-like isoform X3 [Acipenser ruthenus]
MVNTATNLPMKSIGALVPGRWQWEEETQTLQFFSFSQSIDTKDKRKKKAINFQETGSKRADRLPGSPPVTTQGFGGARIPVDKKMMGNAPGIMRGSPRLGLKQGQREHITVEDVKSVAFNLLQENESLSIPLCFTTVMSEQSVTERKAVAEACAKVEIARKQLALKYSILVLGLGMSQQHHMACGKSRVSSTYKDRQLFECLYNFCAYVAWVTFRRKDLKGIQEEVGRLLRSDTFNPAIRVRQASEEQSKKKSTVKGKVCPPERRKRNPKRPAIKSIINQRSPVIVSLLPSPKEKSQYLFKPHRLDQDKTIDSCDIEALVDELSAALSSNFGIIGEPLSQYSMQTLVPCGAEPEDEEEDEQESKLTSKMSLGSRGLSSSQNDSQGNVSRPRTVVSRTTTEGFCSDTE